MNSRNRPAGWTRGRRILSLFARALAFVLGLFALYLIVVNTLISTPLLRSLINREGLESPRVEYASAWSFWPGRVQLRGFRIRDRGVAAEWSVELDEGRARIDLLDLLRGRLSARHLRGTGLVLRARSRRRPEAATPREVAFVPPIRGFPDPPLRNVGEHSLAPTGNEWTMRLEDVVVRGVREIWVDDYRYNGDAELSGGLLLHPRRRLEFFPTSLAVPGGTLRLCAEPLVAAVRARLAVSIRPFDLRGAPGSAVLSFMTGTGRVAGTLENARVLNELLRLPSSLRLEGGSGNLTAELVLDQGRGHGALDFSAAGVQAVMADAVLQGGFEGRLLLTDLDLGAGRADFRGSRVDLREVRVRRGDEEPWLWQARLDLPAGELRTDRPRVFYAHVGLRAPNARPFYRLLDLKLPAWAERLLKLDQFQATADLAVGETFVDLKSLDASGGAFRILGRYHFRKASKKAGSGAFLIDAGSLALGIGLSGGEKKLQLIGARSWFRDQSRTPAGKDEANGGS